MSYRQAARRRLRSQRKGKGENIVWAIQIGLCYCGVGGVGRWGVRIGGLVDWRGIAQEYPPRSKAEPRSGCGVRGGG